MKNNNGVSENSTKNLLKQGTILMIASIVVRMMGLVYRIPLTNLWGDAGNGTYGDAYQVYALFLIISSISVPTMMSQMIGDRLARREYAAAKKVFRCALILVSSLGFICMLIMFFANQWIAEAFFSNPDAALVIRVLSPTVFIVSVMSVLRGYFNGTGNMRPTAISQLIEGFVNAVVSVVMALLLYSVSLSWSVAGGITGTGVGALAGLLFLFFGFLTFCRRSAVGAARAGEAREDSRGIYRQMAILMIPIILSSTMFNLKGLADSILFTKLMQAKGMETEVIQAIRGIYTQKFSVFLNVPIAFGDSLATAVVPSVASCIALKQYAEMKEKIQSVLKAVLLITIPASVGLGVLGKPILHMFFSASPIGGEMFWAGAFSAVFYAVNYVASAILQGMNRSHIPMRNGLICVAAGTALNVFFIWVLNLGAYTLPVSSLTFSFLMMLCNMLSVQKYCRMRLHVGQLVAKPLFCSLLMGLLCFIFYVLLFAISCSNAIAVLGAILIGVAVYFFAMVNTNGITDKDMKELPFGKALRFFRIV